MISPPPIRNDCCYLSDLDHLQRLACIRTDRLHPLDPPHRIPQHPKHHLKLRFRLKKMQVLLCKAAFFCCGLYHLYPYQYVPMEKHLESRSKSGTVSRS